MRKIIFIFIIKIRQNIVVSGQAAAANKRPVVDIESELPLIWKAAHDPSYDHIFRLSVFGMLCGAGASELVQTLVEDVHIDKGYVVLGGTKRKDRSRPAAIVNNTHLQLLTYYKAGSVYGPKREGQTNTNHSLVINKELRRAAGNNKLQAYSLRHTGKHLADVKGFGHSQIIRIMFGWKNQKRDISDRYGQVGYFAEPMINELKAYTVQMIEDLPNYDNDPDLLRQTNVVQSMR